VGPALRRCQRHFVGVLGVAVRLPQFISGRRQTTARRLLALVAIKPGRCAVEYAEMMGAHVKTAGTAAGRLARRGEVFRDQDRAGEWCLWINNAEHTCDAPRRRVVDIDEARRLIERGRTYPEAANALGCTVSALQYQRRRGRLPSSKCHRRGAAVQTRGEEEARGLLLAGWGATAAAAEVGRSHDWIAARIQDGRLPRPWSDMDRLRMAREQLREGARIREAAAASGLPLARVRRLRAEMARQLAAS
jgi:hypothetical protein